MFNKFFPLAVVVVVFIGVAGYQYRVELLDALCGTTPPAPRAQIEEARDNDAMILDVRMYVETRKEGANLGPGADYAPLLRLWWTLEDLPHDRPIITVCESGKRAGKAADMLKARGFTALSGGGISNLQSILVAVNE